MAVYKVIQDIEAEDISLTTIDGQLLNSDYPTLDYRV
jgi:hypothetical protein